MVFRVKMFLAYLVVGSVLTPHLLVRAQDPMPPGSTANPIVGFGREKNGYPFLLSAAGVKGRYLLFTNNRIKIEISREESLGTFDFRRLGPGEVEVGFTSPQGNLFYVRTEVLAPAGKSAPAHVSTSFRFNHSEVKLDSRRDYLDARLSAKKERELEWFMARATSDASLKELTREIQPFLTRASLKMAAPAALYDAGPVPDCASDLSDCMMAAVAYFGSFAGLLAFCGFSAGFGCIALLVAHPIVATHVGIQCSKAGHSCGLAQ